MKNPKHPCTKCHNYGHIYTIETIYGACKICENKMKKCNCDVELNISTTNYDHLFILTENFTKQIVFINPKFDINFTYSGYFYPKNNKIDFKTSMYHLFSSFYTMTTISMRRLSIDHQNTDKKLSYPIQFTKVSFYDTLGTIIDYDLLWFPYHNVNKDDNICHDHKKKKVPCMATIDCDKCNGPVKNDEDIEIIG